MIKFTGTERLDRIKLFIKKYSKMVNCYIKKK